MVPTRSHPARGAARAGEPRPCAAGLLPYTVRQGEQADAMADARTKFMKILRAELEDLLEDLAAAERRHAERFARRELTDYVFKQNDGLFQMEAESLRRIVHSVEAFDAAGCKDLPCLVSAVDTLVHDLVRNHEEPEVICRFVARKLEKVRRYVESCDEPPS
jgi:hypothetical protein